MLGIAFKRSRDEGRFGGLPSALKQLDLGNVEIKPSVAFTQRHRFWKA